jgi:hypothetical protein
MLLNNLKKKSFPAGKTAENENCKLNEVVSLLDELGMFAAKRTCSPLLRPKTSNPKFHKAAEFYPHLSQETLWDFRSDMKKRDNFFRIGLLALSLASVPFFLYLKIFHLDNIPFCTGFIFQAGYILTCLGLAVFGIAIAVEKELEIVLEDLVNYTGVPPINVLQSIKRARDLDCFCDFYILAAKHVPDPVVLGRVQGVNHFFIIDAWDKDIDVKALMKKAT